jgi:hypothetical protein
MEQIIKRQNDEFKKTFREDCRMVKLHFFDPWGTTPENYIGTTLSHVLRGQLEPGAPMAEVHKYHQPQPVNHNRIHVILIVFPITMIRMGEKTKELVKIVNECTQHEHGYDPILVVTHIDDFENQEERKPFLDAIRNTFNNITIFFHQNYTSQKTRSVEIDLSSRLILNAIVNKADNWKAKHRNFFDEVKWKYETVLNIDLKEGYCHTPNCGSKFAQKGDYCGSCKEPLRVQPPELPKPELPKPKPQPIGGGLGGSNPAQTIVSPRGAAFICGTTDCKSFGQPLDGKFCVICGQAGISPAPPAQLFCLNALCGNYNKNVEKFCGSCGGPGKEAPQQKLLCRTPNCVNLGKVVSANFCGECGKVPSAAPLVPLCRNRECAKFGSEVKGNFCGDCGKSPS